MAYNEGKPGKEVSDVPEEAIGRVEAYFSRVGVAAIQLSGALHVGDTVHIRGHTTDLLQAVDSMEIDRQPISEAGPGADVGIRVKERVRDGDRVYRIIP